MPVAVAEDPQWARKIDFPLPKTRLHGLGVGKNMVASMRHWAVAAGCHLRIQREDLRRPLNGFARIWRQWT